MQVRVCLAPDFSRLKVSKAHGKYFNYKIIDSLSLWDFLSSLFIPGDPVYEYCFYYTRHIYDLSGNNYTLLINNSTAFGRAISRLPPYVLLDFIVGALMRATFFQTSGITSKRILPLLPLKKRYKQSSLLQARLHRFSETPQPSLNIRRGKHSVLFRVLAWKTQDTASNTVSSCFISPFTLPLSAPRVGVG